MIVGAYLFSGQTISFDNPPPVRMRHTLVARLVEYGSPWLCAKVDKKGEIAYSIKIPSPKTFGLFAAINSHKAGIPSISNSREIGESLYSLFFSNRKVYHDCKCPKCKKECALGVGFNSRKMDRILYAACSCFIGGMVRRSHIMSGKKLTNAQTNMLNLVSDTLEAALEVFTHNSEWSKTLSCGLDRNQDAFAKLGFANELSRLTAGRCISYMLSVQSNADFSPRFGLNEDKELYESISNLMSWDKPCHTMIHVFPGADKTPPAKRLLVEEFLNHHGGKSIFNRDNLYLVNKYDFSITSTLCSYFFSPECTKNLSLSLHWRWDNMVKPHALEGIWFDACKGPRSAVPPKNMKVINEFPEFLSRLKSTVLPVYITNAQELDFVTMKDVLEQVKKSKISCHMAGLTSSFMPSKSMRMKGRPFLFFAWWRCIRPEPLQHNPSLPHISTPILDTSMDELCRGLQLSNLHSECEDIAELAILSWHENNWEGVEYTVSHEHFQERVNMLGQFQHRKIANTPVVLRVSKAIAYVKLLTNGNDDTLYHVASGDWCGVCRGNRWAPIKRELWDNKEWIVTEIPQARMSPACFVYTVPTKAEWPKKRHVGTHLGLLCTLASDGLSQEVSDQFADTKGTETILVPQNRECSPALSIALDCYHAAVGVPSVDDFVQCEQGKGAIMSKAFEDSLFKALNICDKVYKPCLVDILTILKEGQIKKKAAKRKNESAKSSVNKKKK